MPSALFSSPLGVASMPWVLYVPLGIFVCGLGLVAFLVLRDRSDIKDRW